MTEEVLATSKAPIARPLRRAVVATAGVATVLVGVALIPLPGPGTLVVLGGLTVLRKEFPSAGRAADRIKRTAGAAVSLVRRRRHEADSPPERTVEP
jgi:hypothetical protein